MSGRHNARPAQQLYKEFIKNPGITSAVILKFESPNGEDVYNPSVPFESDGREVIAGRVQKRDCPRSVTMFFSKEGDVYKPVAGAPSFPLEDPFVTIINGEIILGGVDVQWDGAKALSWRTVFYKGDSIFTLKEFAKGPHHMKDIRLVALPDGRIAVCSRPQGEKMIKQYGCIAKIGFTVLPSLEHFTPEAVENAPYLEGIFLPDEWGGANELHVLADGKIGIIGHISHKETQEGVDFLHYYSMAFTVDPDTLETSEIKVICSRGCFPGSESREPRLYDVTFTAGLIRNGDKTASLYTGLSDCQIGLAKIVDPFCQDVRHNDIKTV
ncbi:MAG: DUF1861 family protein [Defluviitaleaceae bacterium]|nr:DUF1861 family protein [Defluviitaleaceae bacterium]